MDPQQASSPDAARLKLREDLVFSARHDANGASFVIEDALNGRFHRIGIAEYAFISLLDGVTTIADATRLTANTIADDDFTEQDAIAVCQWLIARQLVASPIPLSEPQGGDGENRSGAWNPIVVKFTLFNPNHLLDRVLPWMRWATSVPAFVAWLAVLGVAGHQLASNWPRFAEGVVPVLAPENWLWLVGTLLILKLIHELAHGLFCKRYGGEVSQVGVLLILFIPMPFVDVTSCWRFPSKWPRLATSFAGMYAELFVAAVAAIVWCRTEPGLLNFHAYNAMILAGAATVLFNANPLMRFDGYYILSDALELPNLYARGRQYPIRLVRRYLLGLPSGNEESPTRWGAFVKFYGVVSLLWRLVVCSLLVISAHALFYGAGLVLALLAVVAWVGVPAIRFVKFLARGNEVEQPNMTRFAIVGGSTLSIVVAILLFVPWPGGVRAPAVVEYAPLTTIRAGVPGFVRDLRVHPGEAVEAGQIVAVLENRELETGQVELRMAARQSELKCRSLKRNEQISAFQAEEERLASLRQKLDQRQQHLDHLVIRAPVSGRVVGREIDSLNGTHVSAGTTIMTVGSEDKKEILASVDPESIRYFKANLAQAVRVNVNGLAREHSMSAISDIDPVATLVAPKMALGASAAGPLAERVNGSRDQPHWQLVEPRVTVTLPLDETQSRAVKAGQLGGVVLQNGQLSVGEHVYFALRDWLRTRLK